MKKLKIAALLALPVALGLYLNSAMSWRPRTLATYKSPVLSVAWAPDGKRLASAGGDGNVSVWDVGEMRVTGTLSARPGKASAVAFSRDGKWIGASFNGIRSDMNGEVRLWEARSGRLKRAWQGSQGATGVSFSDNGETMASSSAMGVSTWRTEATDRMFDPGEEINGGGPNLNPSFGEGTHLRDAVLSPDGRTVIASDWKGQFYWCEVRRVYEDYWGEDLSIKGRCAAFSPDGNALAIGASSQVALYDAHSRKPRGTLASQSAQLSAAAFSPDGNTLAAGGTGGRIELWDVPSRKSLRTLKGHTKAITSLAFAPDSSTLASSSADGTVRLWRLR